MRIEVGKYSKSAFESLSISRPGCRELVFNAGGYRSTKLIHKDPTEQEFSDVLFNEVNEFIKNLPKAKQQELYDCYQRAEGLLSDNSVYNDETLMLEDTLKEIAKEIYQIVTFDDLHFYVKSNRQLKIPPELTDTYNTTDKITQAYIDKTYTRAEYIDLMTLVLGLRFMIPIWGDYMNIMSTTHGVNMKEYFSFMLLNGSSLRESRAFTRMETYVRANITEADMTMASTLNFLSTDEIPLYAIAATTLRKLSIAPLSYEMDNHHLMKILYSYATSKIKGIGNLEKGLQNKTPNSGGGFADDNSSVFCSFKMKEQISAGELVYIQTYIGRYKEAAERIAEGIDPNIVELCVRNALKIPKWKIQEVQKGLVAWVLSPVVPANIIPMLNRQTLLTAMGISQAVMWHWGLHELAIIVTGRVRPRDPDEFRRVPEGRPLSESTLARLYEIYPYELPTVRGDGVRWSGNAGVRGIALIHEQLTKEDWLTQCPVELAKLCQDADKVRFIEPSAGLRESLAQLLFRLNDLKF